MLHPREYTDKEGGDWMLWKHGPVDYCSLIAGNPTCRINGVVVHSLAFENPAAGFGLFGRWDSVNGWTTTIEDAANRWPTGLHNMGVVHG